MLSLSRRRLCGALGFAAALSACTSLTPAQAQSDVSLIANGLSGIVSALASLPGKLAPSADILAKVQAELDVLKNDAAAIGSALVPSASVAQSVAAAVSAIVPLATPFFPAAPAVAMVIQAALALVPVILQAAGISQAPSTAATAPKMSPDQARLILAAGVH